MSVLGGITAISIGGHVLSLSTDGKSLLLSGTTVGGGASLAGNIDGGTPFSVQPPGPVNGGGA